jgi:hypothetical protein
MASESTVLIVDDEARVVAVGRPMIAVARIQRMTRLFDAHIIVAERTLHETLGLREGLG